MFHQDDSDGIGITTDVGILLQLNQPIVGAQSSQNVESALVALVGDGAFLRIGVGIGVSWRLLPCSAR